MLLSSKTFFSYKIIWKNIKIKNTPPFPIIFKEFKTKIKNFKNICFILRFYQTNKNINIPLNLQKLNKYLFI